MMERAFIAKGRGLALTGPRRNRSGSDFVAAGQVAWFVRSGFTADEAASSIRLVTTHQPSWQDVRAALRRAASSMWRAA